MAHSLDLEQEFPLGAHEYAVVCDAGLHECQGQIPLDTGNAKELVYGLLDVELRNTDHDILFLDVPLDLVILFFNFLHDRHLVRTCTVSDGLKMVLQKLHEIVAHRDAQLDILLYIHTHFLSHVLDAPDNLPCESLCHYIIVDCDIEKYLSVREVHSDDVLRELCPEGDHRWKDAHALSLYTEMIFTLLHLLPHVLRRKNAQHPRDLALPLLVGLANCIGVGYDLKFLTFPFLSRLDQLDLLHVCLLLDDIPEGFDSLIGIPFEGSQCHLANGPS